MGLRASNCRWKSASNCSIVSRRSAAQGSEDVATSATRSPPRRILRGCRRRSTERLGSAVRKSARFLISRGRSRDRNWNWSLLRKRTTLWPGSGCSNCAASAGGLPSTCCYEASDACTSSLAMMWARRSDWLDGLGVHDRWTTQACVERSNDGSPTPAWCISTSCSTGWRRPAPESRARIDVEWVHP